MSTRASRVRLSTCLPQFIHSRVASDVRQRRMFWNRRRRVYRCLLDQKERCVCLQFGNLSLRLRRSCRPLSGGRTGAAGKLAGWRRALAGAGTGGRTGAGGRERTGRADGACWVVVNEGEELVAVIDKSSTP